MTTPRRDFLAWLGAGAALAATGAPLSAAPRVPRAPAPGAGKWDMSWVERIDGKHRAVFDSPEVSEGAGLFRALLWLDQYHEVYGTPREELSAVVVFRHEAIPLVMSDEYWARFGVGKATKVKDPQTHRWVSYNPIRRVPPGLPPQFSSYTLDHFLAQGGIVLACALAFRKVAHEFAKKEKLSPEEADRRAREDLLPGVVLQPSGIFAALRAQEAGCQYVLAS